MKVLTKDEIQAAAEQRKRSAALCSAKHWRQIKWLGAWGSFKKPSRVKYKGPDHCALCVWDDLEDEPGCLNCLRGKQVIIGVGKNLPCCCREYGDVSNLIVGHSLYSKTWDKPTLAAIDKLIARITWLADRSKD